MMAVHCRFLGEAKAEDVDVKHKECEMDFMKVPCVFRVAFPLTVMSGGKVDDPSKLKYEILLSDSSGICLHFNLPPKRIFSPLRTFCLPVSREFRAINLGSLTNCLT